MSEESTLHHNETLGNDNDCYDGDQDSGDDVANDENESDATGTQTDSDLYDSDGDESEEEGMSENDEDCARNHLQYVTL